MTEIKWVDNPGNLQDLRKVIPTYNAIRGRYYGIYFINDTVRLYCRLEPEDKTRKGILFAVIERQRFLDAYAAQVRPGTRVVDQILSLLGAIIKGTLPVLGKFKIVSSKEKAEAMMGWMQTSSPRRRK
jgi:hypothetical protein